MNGLLKYSFPICFSLLALFACEDDGIDVDNIEAPTDEPKQPVVKETKVGRNDPCPCGSGKKYKNCCGKN